MLRCKTPGCVNGTAKVLRWTLYGAIFVLTGAMSFGTGVWPPGGPDTKQAREVAILLGSVLGVLGICAVVIQLTDPQLR